MLIIWLILLLIYIVLYNLNWGERFFFTNCKIQLITGQWRATWSVANWRSALLATRCTGWESTYVREFKTISLTGHWGVRVNLAYLCPRPLSPRLSFSLQYFLFSLSFCYTRSLRISYTYFNRISEYVACYDDRSREKKSNQLQYSNLIVYLSPLLVSFSKKVHISKRKKLKPYSILTYSFVFPTLFCYNYVLNDIFRNSYKLNIYINT